MSKDSKKGSKKSTPTTPQRPENQANKPTAADVKPTQPIVDPVSAYRKLSALSERAQSIITEYMAKQHLSDYRNLDPLNISSAFMQLTTRLMSNPARLMNAQFDLWKDYMHLWHSSTRRWLGETSEPVIAPSTGDKRFKDDTWSQSIVFDFIKQSYLLSSRTWLNTVASVDDLDPKLRQKVEFYTRQFVDALSPSNFVFTNPKVLQATVQTGGENLIKGLENLIGDLERGKGMLSIKMTDMQAFEVGKNIATTKGKVVYENDLMQLIQYNPTTDKVFSTPLLIVPPWINKYYILDMQEKNSFVKWAVDQGHTVFMVSWVNPDQKLAHKTFDDYMQEGPIEALEAIEKATGEKRINIIGYCIAGTMLAALLSIMAQKKDQRLKSATFFTSLTDFKEPGDLGVFVDEQQLAALEAKMAEKGFLEGQEMARTFNLLRANDLIWSFVVNNYLLGQTPFPFDLLYWNSDSTRLPYSIHSFYLRKMYLENALVKPNAVKLLETPVDLTKVVTPACFISTREDHIAPWKSTYAATQLFSGAVKFVLAGSGHIAGIINPPTNNKYSYWTNAKNPKSPDDWLATAQETPGSWWPEWARWVGNFGGEKVKARLPGSGKLKAIEDAPGRYVKVKS